MASPADEKTLRTAESPVAERRCQLLVMTGPTRGTSLILDAGRANEVRIGKAEDNDLCLPDPTISRQHCVLKPESGGWLLVDLDSTNGTFLEETRIKQTYLPASGTLRIGGIEVRVTSKLRSRAMPPSSRTEFGSLVATSIRMREIFALLEQVRDSDVPIMVTGESGTGKGAVARSIHEQSRRAAHPFVVVDCAAVAPSLIESELFGHERGAFTGAVERRVGALEQAEQGTLFLDELDDLRKDLQPKLLRALEERAFQRVGSSREQKFGARVVAASKRNLRSLVKEGRLREDLYFRLAVFSVELPPLRQRKEDLPLLVDRLVAAHDGEAGGWSRLPADVRSQLTSHDWPGNIRELRNTIDRAFALGGGNLDRAETWAIDQALRSSTDPFDVDFTLPFKDVKAQTVDRMEREYLSRLLTRCNDNIAAGAREAGLARRHLYTLLRKHGFRVGDDDPGAHEADEPAGD